MPSMPYVLGFDGGGTRSRLRAESLDGSLLAQAEGGPTNPNAAGLAAVEAELGGLFRRLWAEAGLAPERCAAAFAGNAGLDRQEDLEPFAALFRRAGALGCPLEAGNDAEAALAGALGQPEGLLLIAGTGSIAFGRTRKGAKARAGGWGHLLGDEGSAYWIAQQALARGLRSREGRDLPTRLLEAASSYFRLRAPEDLLPLIYGEGLERAPAAPALIAGFARAVGTLRDQGDPLALELFRRAAEELAALLLAVARSLGTELSRPRVAFRGGLLESDPALAESVRNLLAEAIPTLEFAEGGRSPAEGACALARNLLGLEAFRG